MTTKYSPPGSLETAQELCPECVFIENSSTRRPHTFTCQNVTVFNNNVQAYFDCLCGWCLLKVQGDFMLLNASLCYYSEHVSKNWVHEIWSPHHLHTVYIFQEFSPAFRHQLLLILGFHNNWVVSCRNQCAPVLPGIDRSSLTHVTNFGVINISILSQSTYVNHHYLACLCQQLPVLTPVVNLPQTLSHILTLGILKVSGAAACCIWVCISFVLLSAIQSYSWAGFTATCLWRLLFPSYPNKALLTMWICGYPPSLSFSSY